MTTPNKFQVGDKVQSAPDSSDYLMGAVWIAEITEIVGKNNHGGCYETLGRWQPIKNTDGSLANDRHRDLWANSGKKAPTLRQLWGNHLELVS